MQRFLEWLGMKLFPPKSEPKLRQTGIRPTPKARSTGRGPQARNKGGPNTVNFDAELRGRIEDAGPGKNVLIRNKYVREDTGTHDTLKIIDDSIIETGEEAGFDPYNTGRFDRARNWNSRTGK